MIKISRKVEYALMTLKHMRDKAQDELTTAREICDQYSLPFDTVAKVMQIMNNHHILSSQKGVKGGYLIARSLSDISFKDLSEMIEGKSLEMNCDGKNSEAPCELLSVCNIVSPVQKINLQVMRFFSTLNLEELLNTKSHYLNPKAIHESTRETTRGL